MATSSSRTLLSTPVGASLERQMTAKSQVASSTSAPPGIHRNSTVANLATLNASLALATTTMDTKSTKKASASGEDVDVDVDADGDGDGDDDGDGEDVESAKRLDLKRQLEILRGKLARRNKIIEVVRRAYYQDVIVVKEELRYSRSQQAYGGVAHNQQMLTHRGLHGVTHTSMPPSSSRSNASNAPGVPPGGMGHYHLQEERLSSVPSIDLRDVLPLFAPAETVLKVHPCDSCGGHLELVHGESKELMAARQEMARATKSEQQMKSLVHRLRTEAKEMEDVHDALQQRVKSLVKENSYTLEQLQASRKMERDQKTLISSLRAKLQLAQTTQEDLDHLMAEYKDAKQQLIRSNHDRDIFSASNNHLKEEVAEISKTLHQAKVEKAQLESDYGATYYKLQEEIKKCHQLREELATERATLKDKAKMTDELQQSLTALKDELATTMQRTGETKRRLEDQLAEEERAHEEAQESNLEFRKINKKLLKDLEILQRDPLGLSSQPDSSIAGAGKNHGAATHTASDAPIDMKSLIRKKMEDNQRLLDQALMREHDLIGHLTRQHEMASVAAAALSAVPKPAPMRKKLSRMPSTTIITRFAVLEPLLSGAASDTGTNSEAATDSNAASTMSHSSNSQLQSDKERPRSSNGTTGWHSGLRSELLEGEDEALNEIDEKNFEAYHQDLHRLMVEIEEGKDKSQNQQKVISDLERKNQTLVDRLEESKMAIETLTGSVTALKTRLNQDSAGAAEYLEDMMRQIEDGKKDQQYETERGMILLHFLRTVSNYAYELCDNQAMLAEFDLDRPPNEEIHDESDSLLSPELVQKKRELRKRVLMDRSIKKFSQMCHTRAELVAIELKKLVDTIDRLRMELDEAENIIDSDQLLIRRFEAEQSKLQLMVEVGKTTFSRTDKALKQTTEELQEVRIRLVSQTDELKTVKEMNEILKDDEKRMTAALFEKTRAWEREIGTTNKCTQKIALLEASERDVTIERDALAAKLQEIEDLAEWKRSTNQDISTMASPDLVENEMQTDPWRPQGLILRQRNDPERMPQRYLGNSSVTIACDPVLLGRPSTTATSMNQSPRSSTPESHSQTQSWAESLDGSARDLLAFDLYPPVKAGARQIKTSHAGARPRNLSRLFLSSDGVSQKYIAPSQRARIDGNGDGISSRPSTTM